MCWLWNHISTNLTIDILSDITFTNRIKTGWITTTVLELIWMSDQLQLHNQRLRSKRIMKTMRQMHRGRALFNLKPSHWLHPNQLCKKSRKFLYWPSFVHLYYRFSHRSSLKHQPCEWAWQFLQPYTLSPIYCCCFIWKFEVNEVFNPKHNVTYFLRSNFCTFVTNHFLPVACKEFLIFRCFICVSDESPRKKRLRDLIFE